MLIGHLPAGYLVSRVIAARAADPARASWLLLFGLIGSILPDSDLLWFYFLDGGRVHHHRYITHWPSFWLTLLPVTYFVLRVTRRARYVAPMLVLFLNVLVHLLLDTIVGDVWWLAPFDDEPYRLFTVASVHKPWVLNFVLHWSFALELGLVAAAGYFYVRSANAWRVTARILVASALLIVPLGLYALAMHEALAPDPCNGIGNFNWRSGLCTDTADGASFREKHAAHFWLGYLCLLGACVLLAEGLMRVGSERRWSVPRTAWLAVAAYYVLSPLAYDGFDWHGEVSSLATIFGALISFPTGLLGLGLMEWLSSSLVPASKWPYYPSDFAYGWFSLELSLKYLGLAIGGTLQWFLVWDAYES